MYQALNMHYFINHYQKPYINLYFQKEIQNSYMAFLDSKLWNWNFNQGLLTTKKN